MSDDSFSLSAAASRAAALDRDTLGHFWLGTPLQPWTARREILFLALEAQAIKGSDMVESIANNLDYLPVLEAKIAEAVATSPDLPVSASSLIDWHRFLPAAARVLYLAHHTPGVWSHLRADPATWLEQIEIWCDAHIPDTELEAAVRLAHQLRTEHRQFITIPRPEKHAARVEAGN